MLSGAGRDLVPLVTDASGKRMLAGYIADRGYYPALDRAGAERGTTGQTITPTTGFIRSWSCSSPT